MGHLRREMREAVLAQNPTVFGELRPQLQSVEKAWDTLVLGLQSVEALPVPGRSVKAAREQVLEALALTGVPTAQKTIKAVCEAFFGTALEASRLSSLRRDEVRSYHSSAPRSAYVCSALTASTFHAARSVLARSDWPLSQRILAPSSQRVNFLTMAANLARAADGPDRHAGSRPAIDSLLRHMAHGIAQLDTSKPLSPARIATAAENELEHLLVEDYAVRTAEAEAASQLDHAHQLFGVAAAPQSR